MLRHMLYAKVWTFWIAPLLVAGVLTVLLLCVVGYLVKVVAPKYPPGEFPMPGRRR